jgi:hypothetical protein
MERDRQERGKRVHERDFGPSMWGSVKCERVSIELVNCQRFDALWDQCLMVSRRNGLPMVGGYWVLGTGYWVLDTHGRASVGEQY